MLSKFRLLGCIVVLELKSDAVLLKIVCVDYWQFSGSAGSAPSGFAAASSAAATGDGADDEWD